MISPADYLRDHRFKPLFTDLLGWEHGSGKFDVSVDGRDFSFAILAHKRGLQVLTCSTDRVVLANRTLLRKLQKLVIRTFHEHILIFASEEPRKQVWQWAIRLPDGRKLRHREHPFFSASPPDAFLKRLSGLRFTLDEEESVRLVDALGRVRQVLDTSAELRLFVRRPRLSQRSDELARAMQKGDTESLHEFLLFHLRFARKISKRLCRWFDMLPEDAEQIAFLGLFRAAKKFKPELGYQFSTYATHWVKQACQRYGPDFAHMVHLPAYLFWPCFRLRRKLEQMTSEVGDAGIRDFLANLDLEDPKLGRQFRDFERATVVWSLAEREHLLAARRIAESWCEPLQATIQEELADRIQKAVARLHVREGQIIRLRYGFDGCPEQTLEEIGQLIGLTRERVRQLQCKAEKQLCHWLRAELDEDCPGSSHSDVEEAGAVQESEEGTKAKVLLPG